MRDDVDPKFEVATIKPSKPGTPGRGFVPQGRRLGAQNTSLISFITFTYGLHAKQIVGAPAWLETEKYDITAEPEGEGRPNEKQWRSMLQKLLADRFQFTFHPEKKELSAYAITVGKTGMKLTKSEGDPNGTAAVRMGKLGSFVFRNARVAELADVMQNMVLDRPVVDQTGIAGRFDFTLDWTPEPSQFGGRGGRIPQPSADDPDLFTAMVRQLGLKLEAVKAPVVVLVIDHVEKPSEN